MELKDFVEKALTEIIEAVNDVNKKTSSVVYLTRNSESGQSVEFDIAVSTEDEFSADANTGIKVLNVINSGFKLGKKKKESALNRIKFGVFINRNIREQKQDIDKLTQI